MIISVGGQKGGCGKTTIASELTVYFSTKGKTLLIDADIQGSATVFCNDRRSTFGQLDFTAIQLHESAIREEALKFNEMFDYVIIDAGGYDSVSQRYAISCADIYLAVFNPQRLATSTLAHVEQMVEDIKPANPDLMALSLINLGWSSGTENDDSAEILKKSDTLSYSPSVIQRRKAFCDASSKGMSVMERKPIDLKAKAEVMDLIQVIEERAYVQK